MSQGNFSSTSSRGGGGGGSSSSSPSSAISSSASSPSRSSALNQLRSDATARAKGITTTAWKTLKTATKEYYKDYKAGGGSDDSEGDYLVSSTSGQSREEKQPDKHRNLNDLGVRQASAGSEMWGGSAGGAASVNNDDPGNTPLLGAATRTYSSTTGDDTAGKDSSPPSATARSGTTNKTVDDRSEEPDLEDLEEKPALTEAEQLALFQQLPPEEKSQFRSRASEARNPRISTQQEALTKYVKSSGGGSKNNRTADKRKNKEEKDLLPYPGEAADSIPFFREAPAHFKTLDELVCKISEYLPEKQDVLNVSMVNRQWRRALLWETYTEDIKVIPAKRYVPNVEPGFIITRSKFYSWLPGSIAQTWIVLFLITLFMLATWMNLDPSVLNSAPESEGGNDNNSNYLKSRGSYLLVGTLFMSLAIGWAAFPCLPFMCVTTWYVKKQSGYQTLRFLLMSLGGIILGICCLVSFILATVGADLLIMMTRTAAYWPEDPSNSYLQPYNPGSYGDFFDNGELGADNKEYGYNLKLGLRDDKPWAHNTTVRAGQWGSLLKINDPKGWRAITPPPGAPQGWPHLVDLANYTVCTNCDYADGKYIKRIYESMYGFVYKSQRTQWLHKPSNPAVYSDPNYGKKINISSSSDDEDDDGNKKRRSLTPLESQSHCADGSPAQTDGLPDRYVFLYLNQSTWGTTITVKFSKLGLTGAAPAGVESVTVVLYGIDPIKSSRARLLLDNDLSYSSTNNQISYKSFPNVSKWKRIIVYGIQHSDFSTYDRATASKNFGGIPIDVIEQRNFTLELMKMKRKNTISFSEASEIASWGSFNNSKGSESRRGDFRRQMVKYLGGSDEAAQASMDPLVAGKSYTPSYQDPVYNRYNYNSYGLQPWKRPSDGTWYICMGCKDQYYLGASSITFLWATQPVVAKCQWPRLVQNSDSVVDPTKRSVGSFVYTGVTSFWYLGRRNLPFGYIWLDLNPEVPAAGGYNVPGWCNSVEAARVFRDVNAAIFIICGVLFIGLVLEFFCTMRNLKKLANVDAEFKVNQSLWWLNRKSEWDAFNRENPSKKSRDEKGDDDGKEKKEEV